MGCASTKERGDLHVDEIDETQRQAPVEVSNDAVQALHPRHRYAATSAADPDADDMPGDELANQPPTRTTTLKKKKRRGDDDDEDDEENQPPAKAQGDVETLLASYKDKRATTTSTLLATNKHAQRKTLESQPQRTSVASADDDDELLVHASSPVKGTKVNMKAIMKSRRDDDEFLEESVEGENEPTAEVGATNEPRDQRHDDEESPARWDKRQSTDDIDALGGPAFALKHKTKASPVATRTRTQAPTSQQPAASSKRFASIPGGVEDGQPSANWMPGQVETADEHDDSREFSQSRGHLRANIGSTAASQATSVAKSTVGGRGRTDEDEFAY